MKKPFNTMTLVGVRIVLVDVARAIAAMGGDEEEIGHFFKELGVNLSAVKARKTFPVLWKQAVAGLSDEDQYAVGKWAESKGGEECDRNSMTS